MLASAYRKALVLAREAGARSIAFPLISSGIYGYPFAAAYDTAKKVILDFVGNEDMTVYMVLMNAPKLLPAKKNADIERFLSRHRMPKENRPRKQAVFPLPISASLKRDNSEYRPHACFPGINKERNRSKN